MNVRSIFTATIDFSMLSIVVKTVDLTNSTVSNSSSNQDGTKSVIPNSFLAGGAASYQDANLQAHAFNFDTQCTQQPLTLDAQLQGLTYSKHAEICLPNIKSRRSEYARLVLRLYKHPHSVLRIRHHLTRIPHTPRTWMATAQGWAHFELVNFQVRRNNLDAALNTLTQNIKQYNHQENIRNAKFRSNAKGLDPSDSLQTASQLISCAEGRSNKSTGRRPAPSWQCVGLLRRVLGEARLC